MTEKNETLESCSQKYITDAEESNPSENIFYDSKYLIIFAIIIFIIFYVLIINIIKYFNNMSMYYGSSSFTLNVYENKYNTFNEIYPGYIMIIYILTIVYIYYFIIKKDNYFYFDINKESKNVIFWIFIIIITINIIIIFIYINKGLDTDTFIIINNKTALNDAIYSHIEPRFLYFMYKGGGIDDYIKEHPVIINNNENILKLLITYKFYNDYINSKNRDIICSINNIISKNIDLFLYLTNNNDNILQSLNDDDYNLEILRDNTELIIEKYEEIQQKTRDYIANIKNNSGSIIANTYIFFSITSLIIYCFLIIVYATVLYQKNRNRKSFDAFQIIECNVKYFGRYISRIFTTSIGIAV